MKRFALVVAILLNLLWTSQVPGRGIRTWSYEDLAALSDFVVVARPLQRTHDTGERTTLADLIPATHVIGVASDFETLWVIKGHKLKRFTLHHYRLSLDRRNTIIFDGPQLILFDPKKTSDAYLLFLVRERDGRFAPAGGQTDVDGVSVQQLSSAIYF
jgi:hypothetical protein